ncbi:MAG: AraC family transcriptional regulator [Bacteroidota bacterium]
MKLQYKPIDKSPLSSIHVNRIHRPYLGENWHFHEEYELIYFLKGHGMRIVGDHISNFQEGELVLVGQWLPHLWRNEEGKELLEEADFIVIKFSALLKGVDLFSLPEMSGIKQLLQRSVHGLLFSESCLPRVHDLIVALSKSSAAGKIIHFLSVLQVLANEQDYQLLASADFTLPTEVSSENRLQKVINFIFANYTEEITLDDIAKVAFMTPPAFCRFFKNRTNKTFFNFLNEFRINKACQLLINGERPIKQICYDVGFRSLTNFNRVFRKTKAITPTAYRDNFRLFGKMGGVAPRSAS